MSTNFFDLLDVGLIFGMHRRLIFQVLATIFSASIVNYSDLYHINVIDIIVKNMQFPNKHNMNLENTKDVLIL
jgi:hypothetical protein